MRTLFINARIITPYRILPLGYSLLVDGETISDISIDEVNAASFEGKIIDCQGDYLSPGFIETHTHGAGGYDFMDGTVEAVLTACQTHMKYGMTSIMPTTLSTQLHEITEHLTIMESIRSAEYQIPNLLGSHLEGPYLAPAFHGAQDPKYLKRPDKAEYKSLINEFPSIKKWTIAPELEGAYEMGRFLEKNGVIAAIGHTEATEDEVALAIENGYTMVTHLFNGMSRLTRKKALMYLGVAESTLLHDELIAEIIADGCHLPAALLKLIYKCKGPERLVLVTDSMRAAGTDVEESIIGSLALGQKVEISGGVAYMPGRTSFGGSIATADRLIRTMHFQAGVPLERCVEMMTLTPAKTLNIQGQKGSLGIGKDADIIVFDKDIRVKKVMVMGNLWIQ